MERVKGTQNLIGEVLDEKYRIERLLGQGGMGAVYFATHLGTERPVAVKVISPQFMQNEEFVERFKREARAAGRLRHPNVVDVTDFGFAYIESERVAYLVMEYLDGCTLGDVLAEEKRLPLDWVVDIMEQVCSAVDEAHEQGIVHRDLKPDNIWLEPNRRGGYTIKVLDFGVAKLAGEAESFATASPALTAHSTTATSHPSQSALPSQRSLERFDDDGGTLLLPQQPSEAATQLHTQSAVNEEARTRILSLPHTDTVYDSVDVPANTVEEEQGHEAATLLQPAVNSQAQVGRSSTPPNGEAERTRFLNQRTERAAFTASTSTNEGLTRVGSLLGTPLYMSPEQCRGERLDARSDIYSLAIITYQMLAGETPFTGDLLTIMRLHKEAVPPSLRDKSKKIPKRVAHVVSGALAKNPEDRPANAAAYAGALRAYSEGVSPLMRRASALYSEHFPTFLRISLLAHLPVILIILLTFLNDMMAERNIIDKTFKIALAILLGLLLMLAQYLASSVIAGVTVPLVIQLFVAPLRPLEIRTAFNILRKRLRPFLITTFLVTARSIVGLILGIVPGLFMLVRYHLFAPVVMMEGLEKRAALQRARELMGRARRTVVIILLIQFAIPFIAQIIFTRLAGGFSNHEPGMGTKITSRLSILVNIFVVPLISILTAMVYLKVRQVGGESLKETLDQFEDQNTTRSKWQTRMRERLSLHTRTTR
jgi:serine/threonine protein kinase